MFKSLAAAGVSGGTSAATTVTRLTSDTVAHATLLRLSRLAGGATAIAQSVAILGRHADVRRVARLTELPERTLLTAQDALVAADLMHAGPPMTFVHPIVQASIYQAMPRGQRSLAHAAAARLLAGEGADVEDVAAHLLAAEPGTSEEALAMLRAAAAAALTRGAPESAAAYLQRAALEARTSELRAQVLYELAQAQSVLRRPEAVATFQESMRSTPDPAFRSRAAVDLVETLMVARHWDVALSAINDTLATAGDADAETIACLEVFRAQIMAYDVRLVGRFEAERPHLAEIAARGGRAGRLMAALLAACAIARNEPAAEVITLSTRALDEGVLMAGVDAEAWGPYAAAPLAWLGQRDVALAAAEQMRDAARRRGSVYGFVRGTALHALVFALQGDLRGAEADIRAAFELARDGDAMYGLLLLICWAVDALLERPALDEVAAVFEDTDFTPLDGTYLGAWFLETRGRLRLMRGERAAAADDLRRCGSLTQAFHTVNPMLSQWRSSCALAMPDGEKTEARRLVEEELVMARSTGMPAPAAVALRAAGLVERGDTGIALLRKSVDLAQNAGSPLETARTLVTLGAALRRAGRRAAAEGPLREGLDMAHACGADRLAGRAEEELRTLGFRPRRRALFGAEALTPSEVRVARAAARGVSNREIAQSMFVTMKTVETQLRSVYQKLAITGREQLSTALGRPSSID
jgi:DNA-binding CsgD family transcriptional regulator